MKGVIMVSVLKEENGQFSCRRVIALVCCFISIITALMPLIGHMRGLIAELKAEVFIPCVIFISASVLLLFCTSLTDVISIIKTVRGGESCRNVSN
jgi:hypothetical protein